MKTYHEIGIRSVTQQLVESYCTYPIVCRMTPPGGDRTAKKNGIVDTYGEAIEGALLSAVHPKTHNIRRIST